MHKDWRIERQVATCRYRSTLDVYGIDDIIQGAIKIGQRADKDGYTYRLPTAACPVVGLYVPSSPIPD
jgi:hypothetical protein